MNERHLANTTQNHASRLPGLGQELRQSPVAGPASTSTHLPVYPNEQKPKDLLSGTGPILSQENLENLAHSPHTATPSLNRLPLY